MAARVLLGGSDVALLTPLIGGLGLQGEICVLAPSRSTIVATLAADPVPHLLVLDLDLEDGSAKELLREVRRDPRTAELPVIALSERADELDRVVALEIGADDFVAKPFSVRELVLRIGNLLRRCSLGSSGQRMPRFRLDLEGYRAWLGEQPVELSRQEMRILEVLAAVRGVFSREELVEGAWGAADAVDGRTIDGHIKRIRQKLGPVGDRLQTVRGVG